MVEIRIINEKEIREKQKKDIETYYGMLSDIVNNLGENQPGPYASQVGKGKSLYHVIPRENKGKSLAEFHPHFLTEEDKLTSMDIDVSDEGVFNCIREIIENYSEKYNHLERITIFTDF